MPKIPISPIGLISGLASQHRLKFHRNTFVTPITFRTVIDREVLTLDFPVDPLVSIEQKNTITHRTPLSATQHGSVKEFFNCEDFTINISGLFMSDNKKCVDQYCQQLTKFAQCGQAIDIICPYINDTFNIMQIVIESIKYPFTEGEENQQFALECRSDNDFDLIIETN